MSDPRAIPPVIAGLYLLLVLAASVALHEMVERPAQRWLTGLRKKKEAGPRIKSGVTVL